MPTHAAYRRARERRRAPAVRDPPGGEDGHGRTASSTTAGTSANVVTSPRTRPRPPSPGRRRRRPRLGRRGVPPRLSRRCADAARRWRGWGRRRAAGSPRTWRRARRTLDADRIRSRWSQSSTRLTPNGRAVSLASRGSGPAIDSGGSRSGEHPEAAGVRDRGGEFGCRGAADRGLHDRRGEPEGAAERCLKGLFVHVIVGRRMRSLIRMSLPADAWHGLAARGERAGGLGLGTVDRCSSVVTASARVSTACSRDARAGTAGVLLVLGEAGIGKTALLDYAAGRRPGHDGGVGRRRRVRAQLEFSGSSTSAGRCSIGSTICRASARGARPARSASARRVGGPPPGWCRDAGPAGSGSGGSRRARATGRRAVARSRRPRTPFSSPLGGSPPSGWRCGRRARATAPFDRRASTRWRCRHRKRDAAAALVSAMPGRRSPQTWGAGCAAPRAGNPLAPVEVAMLSAHRSLSASSRSRIPLPVGPRSSMCSPNVHAGLPDARGRALSSPRSALRTPSSRSRGASQLDLDERALELPRTPG